MVELASIFNQHGAEYLSVYGDRILPSHKKAIRHIRQCRTPSLGGSVYTCESNTCLETDYSYHSCNDRNCNKCGGDKVGNWLKRQFDLLLPAPYFFVTYTLPHEFNFLIRSNQKYFYTLLFKTSAQALKDLAKDKRFVGGDIGFFGTLQTWSRDLNYHPHIHYIVPGVALSTDRKKWIKIKNSKFLVHVKPLSLRFKTLFKKELKKTEFYHQIPSFVWNKDFVVHCEHAGYGQEIIKYVAPYVFKGPISNHKIKYANNKWVTFEYENSETKEKQRSSVSVFEFLRRYLQHTLPSGFMKVRYYGIMGSNGKDRYFLLKQLIFNSITKKHQQSFLKIEYRKKIKQKLCPKCKSKMKLVSTFPRAPI